MNAREADDDRRLMLTPRMIACELSALAAVNHLRSVLICQHDIRVDRNRVRWFCDDHMVELDFDTADLTLSLDAFSEKVCGPAVVAWRNRQGKDVKTPQWLPQGCEWAVRIDPPPVEPDA